MNTVLDDITRLCAEVSRFTRKQGWAVVPTLILEFGTIPEFAAAKAGLLMAMTPDLVPPGAPSERKIGSETVEIECYGAVFRLTCRQPLTTPSGPFGANEARVVVRKEIDP